MHSRHTPRSRLRQQRGGAMLVMLVILVMGITTAFITSLSSTAVSNRRNHSTAEVLAQAKEALIGYALTYGDTHSGDPHGYLPCPDTDGSAGANAEGSSETCGSAGANSIGRLPWRTLDLPALFDGSSECLWYAVSGNYKNNPKWGGNMNWDTPAQLHLYGSDGNEIAANEIVALVIAPGAALGSNSDRSGTAAPTCGGNYTAAAYLDNDTVHGKNNADGATGNFILPHDHRDANGNITLTVNDQFAVITRQDLWNAIQNRIARQAQKCLDDYATDATNTSHKYPWAVQVSDATASPSRSGSINVRFGRFPDIPNISLSGGSGTCDSGPLSGLTADQIATLNDAIQQVQDALTAYLAGTGSGSTLNDAGEDLKDLAQDPPYNLPWTDAIRSAGKYVDDNCFGSPKTCFYTATMQTKINSAFTEITDCTGSSGSTDGTMPGSWSSITSCQDLVNSASWSAWRDWMFLQIAEGYEPGGSGSCTPGTSCLSITGSGHTNTVSDSYHAVVIGAAKTLSGQNRSTIDTVSNFLEGNNAAGKADLPTTINFETYRASDVTNYNSVNDRVLGVMH